MAGLQITCIHVLYYSNQIGSYSYYILCTTGTRCFEIHFHSECWSPIWQGGELFFTCMHLSFRLKLYSSTVGLQCLPLAILLVWEAQDSLPWLFLQLLLLSSPARRCVSVWTKC